MNNNFPRNILVRGEDGNWYILVNGALKPVGQETPSYDQALERILGSFVLDEVQKKRLKNLLISFWEGVRDKNELRQALTRPLSLGGVALSEEQAEKIVQEAFGFSQSFAKPEKKIITLPTQEEIEEEAIKKISTQPEKREFSLAQELEKLVDQVVAGSNLKLEDEELKKFRYLISLRLRDIRDKTETKDSLLREKEKGGLGLDTVQADKISAILEEKFKEFQKKWQEEEKRKIEEWKQKRIEALLQRKEKEEAEAIERRVVAALAKKEGALERWYQKQTLEKKVPEEKRKEEKEMAPEKIEEAKKEEVKKVEKPLGSLQPKELSVQTPKEEPADKVFIKTERPKVVDIKFSPRLLSPIEELENLDLTNFRRLGRNPKDIVLKIKSKIDLLGEDSFEKFLAGIAAFKKSEPYQLYLALTQEAIFSGKKIEDLIKEKKEKTLTVEEFYAIMELTKSLRI